MTDADSLVGSKGIEVSSVYILQSFNRPALSFPYADFEGHIYMHKVYPPANADLP